MEHLLIELSKKVEPTILMLISPKYYCHLAGEGIEFVWGMLKRQFRSSSLEEKTHKTKIQQVCERGHRGLYLKEDVIRFAGLSCRYMMAYRKHANSYDKTLTFDGID